MQTCPSYVVGFLPFRGQLRLVVIGLVMHQTSDDLTYAVVPVSAMRRHPLAWLTAVAETQHYVTVAKHDPRWQLFTFHSLEPVVELIARHHGGQSPEDCAEFAKDVAADVAADYQ